MSVFEEIRSQCRRVAEVSTQVTIDDDRLESLADQIAAETFQAPMLDQTAHFSDSTEATLAYHMVLDAINFGSGFFPYLKKLEGKSGYFTVATHLTDHFRRHGAFTAEELMALDAVRCGEIFGQTPPEAPITELMQWFAQALNDLGRLLDRDYAGSYMALVESAEQSPARMVDLLCRMPFYQDVQSYRGWDIPFYKRAQLTIADLALAFQHQGPGSFRHLEELTIFADNLVPHVLRVEGVLRYTSDLAACIDREDLIVSGSEAEIEIRACAVHAVEQLRAELERRGRPLTSMQLDYLFWNRGQQPYYKQMRPRHRCRTVFY